MSQIISYTLTTIQHNNIFNQGSLADKIYTRITSSIKKSGTSLLNECNAQSESFFQPTLKTAAVAIKTIAWLATTVFCFLSGAAAFGIIGAISLASPKMRAYFFEKPTQLQFPLLNHSEELSRLEQEGAAEGHLIIPRSIDSLHGLQTFLSENQERLPSSHESAKKAFEIAAKRCCTDIQFTTPGCTMKELEGERPYMPKVLNPDIFSWAITPEVRLQIEEAASKPDEIHLFGIASQFNATEETEPSPPPPGAAISHSQGAAAQKTNPYLFEIANAFLSNGGFNMLEYVLPKEIAKNNLKHGYLSIQREELTNIINAFENNWHLIEAPVMASVLRPDAYPVYLMLGATPAFLKIEHIDLDSLSSAEKRQLAGIQYFSALATFTSQFRQLEDLAKNNPAKKIVYHPIATGLSLFNDSPEALIHSFKIAAVRFESRIAKLENKNIKVQFGVSREELSPQEDRFLSEAGLIRE